MNPRKRFRNDTERQTERRVNRRMMGLNTQGKPYRRHPNFINQAEGKNSNMNEMLREQRSHRLARTLKNYYTRAKAFKAQGLSSHGKPLKRKPNAWKQFRASIIIPQVCFSDAYVATKTAAKRRVRISPSDVPTNHND